MISVTTIAALRGYSVPNAVNMPLATLHAPELQRLTTVAGAAGHLLSVLQPEIPSRFRMMTRRALSLPYRRARFRVGGGGSTGAVVRPEGDAGQRAGSAAADLGIELRSASSTAENMTDAEFTFEAPGETPRYVKVAWDRHNAGIVEVDRFSLGMGVERVTC